MTDREMYDPETAGGYCCLAFVIVFVLVSCLFIAYLVFR